MSRKIFFEKTLKFPVKFCGNGLFTGKEAKVTLHPAAVGTGIVFKKVLADRDVFIPAQSQQIRSSSNRNTVLSDGTQEGTIFCVEHLLSALFGSEVTNVVIEIEGSEVPIMDGSAMPFVEAILNCGVVNQEIEISPIKFDKPFYWSTGNIHIIALPSEELRFSYTLSYEGHPLLSSQFFTFPFSEMGASFYLTEVAPARTFCLYEEAKELLASGMIPGGGLGCAVVIKGEEVINPEGLRFKNEMARHKVLDMIGDLALIGRPMLGHFIGIRSGHEANATLVRKIVTNLQIPQEEIVEGAYV